MSDIKIIEIAVPEEDKSSFDSKLRQLFETESVSGTPIPAEWDYIIIHSDWRSPLTVTLNLLKDIEPLPETSPGQ